MADKDKKRKKLDEVDIHENTTVASNIEIMKCDFRSAFIVFGILRLLSLVDDPKNWTIERVQRKKSQ